MAGYTQAELQAIFSASGIDSDYSQRRLAAYIIQGYVDLLNTARATSEQQPTYNYNTRKYFASMSRPLIELATACYGQNYTAAQITALAQTEAYGPLSYTFATQAPNIVQAIYACMEVGVESIAEGNFATQALWDVANGFGKSASGLTYTHNAGANTATQTAANRATVETMVASSWYVLDFQITTAPATIAQLTSYQLGTGVCSVATNIAPITAAGFGLAGKKSLIFKSSAGAAAGDFVFTAVSSAAATNIVTNISLKQILNTAYSTNPLSNFSSTQVLYYGSLGSNYCKKFIAGIVTSTLQKMAQGEYSVYGTLNKQAEPVTGTGYGGDQFA